MPLYYRKIPPQLNMKSLSLLDYISNSPIKKYLTDKNIKSNDFDKTLQYYNKKKENEIVGILKYTDDNKDIFKLRHAIKNTKSIGRGKGVLNYTGSVCTTSVSYTHLTLPTKA